MLVVIGVWDLINSYNITISYAFIINYNKQKCMTELNDTLHFKTGKCAANVRAGECLITRNW